MAWALRREGTVWALLQDGTTVDESGAKHWTDALAEMRHHCDGSRVEVVLPSLDTIEVKVG